MRYDDRTERYRDCRWCRGRGCLYCKSEADKDYRAAFLEGPQPIATFTAEEKEKVREAIGVEALSKAFGPGGGGIAEIVANVARVKGRG